MMLGTEVGFKLVQITEKQFKNNKMNTIDIEKLNQLISRADISGNDKVRWLTDFIDGREFEQQEKCYSEEEGLITLLKTTTEYEVLQSFRDKVEQFKNK